MARQGQVIENPRRRERILLVETGDENQGRRLVLRVWAEPCDVAPPMHFHPHQRETFKIVRGALTYVTGSAIPRRATAGETVSIEPGVSHTWWNADPETLEVEGILEPAGRFQLFIETVYGLIRDGRVTRRGIPHPLQMAVIAHEFRRDMVFTAIPRLARPLLRPAAFLGRLLGYQAWYPAYSGEVQRAPQAQIVR